MPEPFDDDASTKRANPAVELWRAEVAAMFDRMQTPGFARAALKALDEPLRVAVPDHLQQSEER
jgi:hypothetical protein